MIISNGQNKLNIAVFISGKGSNLKNLIEFSLKKNSKFKITLIVSSKSKAKGLGYSKKYNIEKKIFNFKNQENTENKLIRILKDRKINLICLAGFMKILSKNFIKKFNGKIINIHPSLLPKYKGLDTHLRVLKNKEKYSGCTVHFVNSKLDSGKIILQKKVKIFKKDTASKLKKRVQKEEYKLYPIAIKRIIN